ncbi:MAG TPA: hypothetical protein VEY07_06420 [Thermoplasmata archaeon]|nr:hypothetical protein [Thermoplasmata archaeon]
MDYVTPVLTFVGGAAVGALAWWLWNRASAPQPLSEPVSPPAPVPAAAPDPPSPVVAPSPDPPRRERPTGEMRISQRVVLHLSRQPRLAYGDVAPVELTQRGMTQSLSVAQPALAKVLARLVDGGALLEMRTHVSGASRRLKVYQLTALGESIAVELRRRVGPIEIGRDPSGHGPRSFRPIEVTPLDPDRRPPRR